MPAILAAAIPAVIGGAVAINSANQQSKAANNALAAQNAATDKQIAAQQQALQQITALQNPFIQAGYGGISQLQSQYGLGPNGAGMTANSNIAPYSGPGTALNPYAQSSQPALMDRATGVPEGSLGTGKTGNGVSIDPASAGPPSGTPQTSPAGASPAANGQPDWNAYIQAYPDVAAWIAQGHGDPSLGPNQTPAQAAAYQYQHTGQAEGRQLPMLSSPAANGSGATAAPLTAQQQLTADVGVSPTFQRPDQGTMPDFGTAPTQASYFSNFQADPGFQFTLNNALRAANANYGARGLLQSDAAVKGLMSQATGLANQTYGDWFNRQNTLYGEALNQYNADRSANFNIFNTNRANTNANYNFDTNQALGQFNTNRSYLTDQYNNQVNNLFKVAALGTGAAGSIAGANSNFANAATNIFGQQGSNAATAANQIGAANSQLGGALGGIANNFANSFTNLYNLTPMNVMTSGANPYGGKLANNSFDPNVSFVNPLPTTSYSSGGGF